MSEPDSTNIPYGFCYCGCGQRTNLAPYSHKAKGWVKGEPKGYVHGHNNKTKHSYDLEDRGYSTPCWIWTGYKTSLGYGQLRRKGRQGGLQPAHVHYYEHKHGPIPEGLELDHLCRVPSCVNPDHLDAVTHATNLQRSKNAKFTPEGIRELRRRYAQGGISQRALARELSVSSGTISRIISGERWSNI